MATAGIARVLLVLSGDSAGAVAAIGETDAALGKLDEGAAASGGFLSGLGDALLTAGKAGVVLAVVIAAASTQLAANFQQATTRLITNAGETRDSVDNIIAPALLRLAVEAGYSTSQLAEGFRQVSSAGFKAQDGVNVLTVAVHGARAENADLGVVLNVVTSILNAYNLTSDKASGVMNTLIAAMQNGKLTLQDLSSSLGNVIPAASQANVSLDEVTSAMAVMANEGIKPANASTYLRFTLLALENSTPKAQKALKDVGLSASDLRSTLVDKGLVAAIELLEEHIGKKYPAAGENFKAEMAKVTAGTEDMDQAIANLTKSSPEATGALMNIIGGIRGAQGVLALGGAHLEAFAKMTHIVANAAKDAGTNIIGWNEIQGNFNFQFSRARELIEVTGIKLGQVLLPYLTDAARAFTDAGPTIQAFADKLGVVFDAIAGVASGRYNLAGGTFRIMWEALGLDPATAAKVSDTVTNTFDTVGKAIRDLLPVAKELGADMVKLAPYVLDLARGLSETLGPALQFVHDHGDQLKPILIALAVGFGAIKAVELGLAIADWATQFAIVATNIGKTQAAMSALGVTTGMQDALGWIGNFGSGALGAIKNFGSMTASAIAEGAKTSASAGVEAAKTVALWIAAQVKIAAGWVALQAKAAATYVQTVAAANPSSNAAVLVWIAAHIKIAAGWVALEAKAIATFVGTAAGAAANAIRTAAAWAAAWAQVIAGMAAAAVASAVDGARMAASQAAAALATRVQWAIVWVQVAAGYVAIAAASVLSSARQVVAIGLSVIAMGAARVATIAWAVAQEMLDAALLANPIGLVVLAIGILIAIIVLLITHWSQVVHWLQQVWSWIRTAAAALSDFIDKHRVLAVVIAILGGPITVIIGIIALLITHWNQVSDAVGAAMSQLGRFGDFIRNQVMGTLNDLAAKAKAVGDALNSINPFAQHSPSLVQNVEAGTKVIAGHYEDMAGRISASAKGALTSLQALTTASASGSLNYALAGVAAPGAGGLAAGAGTGTPPGGQPGSVGDIHVNVLGAAPSAAQIARELAWSMRTR